jgi:hypothetical protein
VAKKAGIFETLLDFVSALISPAQENISRLELPAATLYPKKEPLRLWLKNGRGSISYWFPEGIGPEHLLSLYEHVFVERKDPTERDLTGNAGPFTGKPEGTLSQLRNWCFSGGLAEPKGSHPQAGWSFNQKGLEMIVRWLWHPEIQTALPYSHPRRPARPVRGRKQKYAGARKVN